MELNCESTVDISTCNDATNLNERRENIKPCNMGSLEAITLVPLVVRRSTGCLKLLPHSSIENPVSGFRKIEPKPTGYEDVSSVQGSDEVKETKVEKKRRKKKEQVRLLGSNCTRRGVKLCVTCKGTIGYRSKQCKHCSRLSVLSQTSLERSQGEGKGCLASSRAEEQIHEQEKLVEECTDNDTVLLLGECVVSENKVHITIELPEKKTLDETNIQEQVETYADDSSDLLGNNDSTSSSDQDVINEAETTDNTEQQANMLHKRFIDAAQRELLPSANETQNPTIEDLPEATGQSIDKMPVYNTNLQEKQDGTHHVEDTGDCDNHTSTETNNLVTPVRSKRKGSCSSDRTKKQKVVHPFVQFVTIMPKPAVGRKLFKDLLKPSAQGNIATNTGRNDSKKFLSSNATRRGIMPCPLCQKNIGCRSKVCKFCHVAIQYTDSNALEHKNLLVVQLSPLTDPKSAVFSVKKMCTPSEERCFLKKTTSSKPESEDECVNDNVENHWSCECDQNTKMNENSHLCEHTMFFLRSPKVVQARTAQLKAKTIDFLPIDNSFKNKLKKLWERNQVEELPLVQQVALNTLVVLETMHNDDNMDEECATSDCTNTTTMKCTNCVHIRFEKIRNQSLLQPHIFCSGKSCSYWRPLEGQKNAPATCLHYCISLWAIASDVELEGYFKIFLEAPIVYLHSDVFDGIITSS